MKHGFGPFALATLLLWAAAPPVRAEAPAEVASDGAGGPLLALREAIALGLAHNPAIDASRQSLDAAGHKIGQARAGFYPQLVMTLGYKRATMNQAMPPYFADMPAAAGGSFRSFMSRETMDNYDNFSAQAALTQTLWDGLRTLGSLRASEASAEGARADVSSAQDAVCMQVTQAYFAALAAQEATATALEVKRQMQRHIEVARALVAAEVRQRIDVVRAEADLAAAELGLRRARNAHELGRIGLNLAMGASGPPGYRIARPPPAEHEALPPVEEAVRAALVRRPEHASLAAKARAAEHQVMVARSALWPTASASASWSHAGYELGDLPYNWSLGVNVSWSAVQVVQTRDAVGEAEANHRALLANLRSLELGVRAEVEAAIVACREARERMEPAEAMIAAARETLRLAEGRYAAGAGSIIEVTDAQALYTQARLQLIQAELDAALGRARLRKVLGLRPCAEEER